MLPTDLNRLLIIVVVLSMALTPFLAEAGKRFAEFTAPEESTEGTCTLSRALALPSPVLGSSAVPGTSQTLLNSNAAAWQTAAQHA